MTTHSHTMYLNWYETDPKKTPEQIIREAATHYHTKYGQSPTLALVPLNFPNLNGQTPEGLHIQRHKDIPPGYVWLKIPELIPQQE
jgi:hypothetical protein